VPGTAFEARITSVPEPVRLRLGASPGLVRDGEAPFRTIFEYSFTAILVLDGDGRILEANPATQSLTGLDRGQLLGRRLSELLLDQPPAPGESVGVAKLRRADGAVRSLTLSRQQVAPDRQLVFAMDVTALEAVTADRDLLRALSAHRFEAQEEASRRIARELHDEAGEVLTSVHLRLDELRSTQPAARRRVREIRSLLDEVERRLRRISHELRPIILDDLGLASALEQLVEGAASRTKTRIRLETGEVGRLPPPVETALYRIAQEALVNALRHAQAKRVRIRAWRDAKVVSLSVEDDGIGLDTQACRTRRNGARRCGLGLAGIRERAESLGGVLELRPAPRHGLEVRVRVPL
jgi:PAS domain S-box-containing protein